MYDPPTHLSWANQHREARQEMACAKKPCKKSQALLSRTLPRCVRLQLTPATKPKEAALVTAMACLDLVTVRTLNFQLLPPPFERMLPGFSRSKSMLSEIKQRSWSYKFPISGKTCMTSRDKVTKGWIPVLRFPYIYIYISYIMTGSLHIQHGAIFFRNNFVFSTRAERASLATETAWLISFGCSTCGAKPLMSRFAVARSCPCRKRWTQISTPEDLHPPLACSIDQSME